ncbi:MAG: exonuclease [Gammaproteobacteria bacterium]
MAAQREIYVSTDIEADGPIPGPHSMLSFASAAYTADGTLLQTYTANLETLPGASADARTMEWWQGFPEAWAACRRDPRAPQVVMPEYLAWLTALSGRLVFLGWPASWDFMWIYWYLFRFTGERPFRENALDVRSYVMGMRRVTFTQTSRTYLPKRWFDNAHKHTHIALDDALEQGAAFFKAHAENTAGPALETAK